VNPPSMRFVVSLGDTMRLRRVSPVAVLLPYASRAHSVWSSGREANAGMRMK
jgi:hypothetical protein